MGSSATTDPGESLQAEAGRHSARCPPRASLGGRGGGPRPRPPLPGPYPQQPPDRDGRHGECQHSASMVPAPFPRANQTARLVGSGGLSVSKISFRPSRPPGPRRVGSRGPRRPPRPPRTGRPTPARPATTTRCDGIAHIVSGEQSLEKGCCACCDCTGEPRSSRAVALPRFTTLPG